ncbi:MAG: 23S rRNA (uracil(1939)-C(5))-methyltransferase RlmD [Betaproteobacteria bacterium]|nr:23S rRNA (uracil(1939)-C(5))-methyltransferase RlmD [Betaproteobacteria bacterium]
MGIATVESLNAEGRGVAHVEGKAIFIEGALPFEVVEYETLRRKPNYEVARTTQVLRASPSRTTPQCPHFGVCGGCAMQHADAALQIAAKQRALENALWHVGRVRPETMLRPIEGPSWGYRHRARLTSRFVAKKGVVLVGFHERKSTFVADMTSCEVLPAPLSVLLVPLRRLVESLSCPDRIPQIEVSVGADVTVLVFRTLVPLVDEDKRLLRAFSETHKIAVWLQPQGPETAHPFHPLDSPPLDYTLPEYGVRIGFLPTDFTQVNHAINASLVRRAMGLIDPQAGELIYDLFCGLGNFSLPMARLGARVVGYEGSVGLVKRARENARRNGLETEFRVANLFQPSAIPDLSTVDKLLIDPPREGALDIVKAIAPDRGPRRIVYVSCDPATLARDAGILVGIGGYRLLAAGIANMFPHTSHVESIACFSR